MIKQDIEIKQHDERRYHVTPTSRSAQDYPPGMIELFRWLRENFSYNQDYLIHHLSSTGYIGIRPTVEFFNDKTEMAFKLRWL